MLIWGCRPRSFVEAKSQMVNDVVKVLLTKYNPKTMTIELPYAFDHIKNQDANFEMVTSNTI